MTSLQLCGQAYEFTNAVRIAALNRVFVIELVNDEAFDFRRYRSCYAGLKEIGYLATIGDHNFLEARHIDVFEPIKSNTGRL
jgi:hypothetical protein